MVASPAPLHRPASRTAAAAVLLGAAFGLAGCAAAAPPSSTPAAGSGSASSPAVSPPSTTTARPSASAAPEPATDGGRLTGVPIYWVGDSRGSLVLYRELRNVPVDGGLIASAVAAMTRMQPLDRDYVNPWRPATRVTASQAGTTVRVDLSKDAISATQVGSELADRAVQQLVHTATAAAARAGRPASTVVITVDGRAAEAWGVLRLGEPTRRARQVDVLAHVWVTSPQEGDRRPAGTVTFTGYGTSFEASFGWVVRDAAGSAVATGHATGGTGTGGFGELRFSAALQPGTYTVELSTDDPAGGAEGRGPAKDTKTFTVG